MRTFVLWLLLANGQVATIPGFSSQGNCNEVGHWYQQESERSDKALQFKCGPGPDISGVQVQFPFPLGRR